MINVRLTTCSETSDILTLLNDIECKITDISKNLYNNTVFALNAPIKFEVMTDLLIYRRILQYKYCNADYVKEFSVNVIASRVKLLKYK